MRRTSQIDETFLCDDDSMTASELDMRLIWYD